jgi:hypothetical protein
MKKILLFFIGFLLVTRINAQEGQETSPSMWLGGEVTFGSMSNLDFTLGPSFGIMITDEIGAGGTFTYSSGNNANAWGIEIYGRYYLPVVDQLSFFGDVFLGIGGGDQNVNLDGDEYNTLDFGARLGLQYWFTPRWSMAASNNVLVYNSRNSNGEFGAGLKFSTVNFSFFFHF